ncbi:hypothetical protein HJ201_24190 [Vibrio parahaemolyticus]|nr:MULTISPECIES: hypothetical protein [Vibrio]EGR2722892.1 hypothetical protein [Vibrio parahaemolyticus]EGS6762368.1 hypothetical protein [Vibrio parahaemolyticus]EGY8742893.1 hypothetical protein [Vibrio parahaemolyticus]EHE6934467.1 hypothetical protein [Vibrio parahaemolyticus]ELP2672181.1 hypothetical protein [Vibrio parahaemolyticus]
MNIEQFESPFVLCPELQEEHLEFVSKRMLQIVEMTLQSNSSEYDDNYTFETSIFGRTRQLFFKLAEDKSIPWLTIASKTMDYVPKICTIPVRVFKDDPSNPKKGKVFFKNDCEQSQLTLFDDLEGNSIDLTWRLFIQAPATVEDTGNELEDLEDDYRVVLVGYDSITKQMKSVWQSNSTARHVPYPVEDALPAPAEVKKVEIEPLRDKEEVPNVAEDDV